MIRLRPLAFPLLLLVLATSSFAVEKQTIAGNSDADYLALRNPVYSGEAYAVKDLKLERDGATFTFTGTFWPFAPVNGKVTGAVFVGQGTMVLDPPIDTERRQLALLTKTPRMQDSFEEMYLRFTDSTYADITAAGQKTPSTGDPGNIDAGKKRFRDDLEYNVAGRLLQDVKSHGESGFFAVLFKGKNYGKLFFEIDPHGLAPLGTIGLPLAPEEVSLTGYDEMKYGIWCAYHRPSEYASHSSSNTEKNALFSISDQKIDLRIEKNGHLEGTATTSIVANASELAVVPLSLYPSLRVSAVSDSHGAPLGFIQEDKDHDSQFFIILKEPIKRGDKIDVVTQYAGKDALQNTGGSNYYMAGGARDSWYPNTDIGHFENYDVTFHIPKGLNIVATGNPVSEKKEDKEVVSEWKTSTPEVNAGFQLGKFKKVESKPDKYGFTVESYANQDSPDIVSSLRNEAEGVGDFSHNGHMSTVALGTLSTVDMGKKALAEGQLATQFYTWLYGPSRFKRLAMTQQTAVNYGQSWPGLIYLPITYFFDDTVKHQIGVGDFAYFRVVAPHEVAHQWWGDSVGFNSYRDQWMSEGFADQAAAMYLQLVLKEDSKFMDFWKDERKMILHKNSAGLRPNDVGPLTMGYRLETYKSGRWVTRELIYPKGAFVLHMLRMMMWSTKTGDNEFRAMMTDFAQTYSGKNATTEDFKSIAEKHMTAEMDLDHNRRLDWFFNEYVYGTEVPTYNFDYKFEPTSNGTVKFSAKLTQSGVSPQFKMLVPVYIEVSKNHVIRLGNFRLTGDSSFESSIDLPLKQAPTRAFVNYYYDVLATE